MIEDGDYYIVKCIWVFVQYFCYVCFDVYCIQIEGGEFQIMVYENKDGSLVIVILNLEYEVISVEFLFVLCKFKMVKKVQVWFLDEDYDMEEVEVILNDDGIVMVELIVCGLIIIKVI